MNAPVPAPAPFAPPVRYASRSSIVSRPALIAASYRAGRICPPAPTTNFRNSRSPGWFNSAST